MQQWEYCEVDFSGNMTHIYYYDEAGTYIDRPVKQFRLGVVLAKLGNDGWEIISCWWRNSKEVTYMLKRARSNVWTEANRIQAEEDYKKNHPKDLR